MKIPKISIAWLIVAVLLLMGAGVENRVRRIATYTEDLRHIYAVKVTALANPYFRIYNGRPDKNAPIGKLWDTTANSGDGGLVAAGSVAWSDSDIAFTDNKTTVGGLMVAIPATLPNGDYDLLVYDGNAPDANDTIELGRRITIKSGFVTGMDEL